MQIEWELTLECNFTCRYCTNGRNSCLKTPIKEATDEAVLEDFIRKLPDNTEIFLFGGEPVLHPKFDFIIGKLNEFKKKYVLQTNFSIDKDYSRVKNIQVSIHKQSNINDILKRCLKYKPRRIDIMFYNKTSIEVYYKFKKYFNTYIAPVSDFNTEIKHLKLLNEYIALKEAKPQICEPSNRCYAWKAMLEGKYTTFNKPCLYKDFYILYAPDLKSYNCSHRINCDICPNQHCFLMDFQIFQNTRNSLK